MERAFSGQIAFVTGGASGIGAAACRQLIAAGAQVAVADRDGAELLAAELGPNALALTLDVTDRAGVQAAVDACVAHFGGLHLAINSAGIGAARHDLADLPPDEWDRMIAVNLTGVFNSMRAEIPPILAAGGGAIVNIASICGLVAVAGTGAYTASKHAVIGLTKAAALDYAGRGIRINALAPGFVDTPLLAGRPAEIRDALAAQHPVGRLASADEIAQAALYLLGSGASFLSGTTLTADGGYTTR